MEPTTQDLAQETKLDYTSPKLIEYGSLAELTGDQLTGPSSDAGSEPFAYTGGV
jgi:hypothetical protein